VQTTGTHGTAVTHGRRAQRAEMHIKILYIPVHITYIYAQRAQTAGADNTRTAQKATEPASGRGRGRFRVRDETPLGRG